MTLDELEERGRTCSRNGLPLGTGLRKLAAECGRHPDEFNDRERRAFADGWHEVARERIAGGEDP